MDEDLKQVILMFLLFFLLCLVFAIAIGYFYRIEMMNSILK
jgi:uncharacterized protein YneF (UPF0154 family)